jgi:DNA-binding HxlR family transcriptional regulator
VGRTADPQHEVRQAFDAYFENCPSRRLLERISDKWVVLIMSRLADGSMRYSELAAEIAGVSPKMLTQTLRALERDGLVNRHVTPSVPPRVDYELTTLGHSLSARIAPLKAWAENNMDTIQAARDRYDAVDRADS